METLLEPELSPVQTEEKTRILVIDDDRDQVEVLQYHLSQQGFEVAIAYNGSDGIRQLKENPPHLVILDIELPDSTGLQICEQISDNPDTFQIPVIFVSGVEQSDILRKARAAGCSFYVRKPYDPNALLVLIKQTLSESIL